MLSNDFQSVIASEAKQSSQRFRQLKRWLDCFVALLLAMTASVVFQQPARW
jgi:hypothetical protein